MANQVYQRGRLGAVHRVFTVDARVATGAIVVDQQQFQAHELVDQLVQVQEVSCFQGLMETLHQQLWAVTVDSQAAGAFLAAMKQAVAVSALGVQLVDQVLAIIEGGAQRLIQGSHGARLAVNGARSLTAIGAGLHQPHPPMGTLHRAIAHRPAQQRRTALDPGADHLPLQRALVLPEQAACPVRQQVDPRLHHQRAKRFGQRAG